LAPPPLFPPFYLKKKKKRKHFNKIFFKLEKNLKPIIKAREKQTNKNTFKFTKQMNFANQISKRFPKKLAPPIGKTKKRVNP